MTRIKNIAKRIFLSLLFLPVMVLFFIVLFILRKDMKEIEKIEAEMEE